MPEPNQTNQLISEESIQARVKELAGEIRIAYTGKKLLMVGILKGAFVLAADLARELWRLGLEDFEVDFIGVSSYGSATESSRNPKITKDLEIDIESRHVLLVEDIIDTGWSLSTLLNMLRQRKPKSLETLVLLSKPSRREIDVAIKFIGFEIADKWVEGYGIDTNQQGRGRSEVIERTVGGNH